MPTNLMEIQKEKELVIANNFLTYIHNGLQEIYPNLCFYIRILLTTSVEGAGRSYTKMKLIKNMLRSTMTGRDILHLQLSQSITQLPNLWTGLLINQIFQKTRLERRTFCNYGIHSHCHCKPCISYKTYV